MYQRYTLFSALVQFVLPLIVIIILYSRIYVYLKVNSLNLNKSKNSIFNKYAFRTTDFQGSIPGTDSQKQTLFSSLLVSPFVSGGWSFIRLRTLNKRKLSFIAGFLSVSFVSFLSCGICLRAQVKC